MEHRVGIRELRAQLSKYLDSSIPIEVTRHGQTLGIYIPLPKNPTQDDRAAMREASTRLQEELLQLGLTEDQLLADFQRWRAKRYAH
jgi:antitoxin (DNA-binding transcriptional repressor) of toxin-antitoxin stability system